MCDGKGALYSAQRYELARDAAGRRIPDADGYPLYNVIESHPISSDMSSMHIREKYHGYAIVSRQCDCVEHKLRGKRLLGLGKAEMPDDVAKYGYGDFAQYPAALYWAGRLVERQPLIDADGNEKFGLLLTGPLGTGKTTLGTLIYLQRQQQDIMAIWCRYASWMRRLTDTMDEDYSGPTISNILNDLMVAPFLMLDELGNLDEVKKGVTASRFRNEHLLTVIDYRWAHHLSTVITTNLSVTQLYEYFDAAIISRLRGLCFVEVIDGVDHRTGEGQR